LKKYQRNIYCGDYNTYLTQTHGYRNAILDPTPYQTLKHPETFWLLPVAYTLSTMVHRSPTALLWW